MLVGRADRTRREAVAPGQRGAGTLQAGRTSLRTWTVAALRSPRRPLQCADGMAGGIAVGGGRAGRPGRFSCVRPPSERAGPSSTCPGRGHGRWISPSPAKANPRWREPLCYGWRPAHSLRPRRGCGRRGSRATASGGRSGRSGHIRAVNGVPAGRYGPFWVRLMKLVALGGMRCSG